MQQATTHSPQAEELSPMIELPASTYEVFYQSAQKNREKNALHFFLQGANYEQSLSYTYAQLLDEVHQTANMFHHLGLGFQDTVSYLLPNLPATLLSFLGGEAAGIVNPINPLLESEQIVGILKEAETKILIVLGPTPGSNIWEKTLQIIKHLPLLTTVLVVRPEYYLGFTDMKLPNIEEGGAIRFFDFYSFKKEFVKEQLSYSRPFHTQDIASLFHTGGTTGTPKLAQHSHRNEVFSTHFIQYAIPLEKPKVFLCGLPWFHVNAVIVTGLVPLFFGHSLVLASPLGYRDVQVIKNFWKIIERYQVSFFSCVPTILQTLLQIPKENSKLDSLEFAFCGAAPLSVKLLQDFEEHANVKIIEGYGFTEGVCVSTLNPYQGIRKIGSIGLKLAHHDLKVALLNEAGTYVKEAATNEIGLLIAKGEHIMPGYKQAQYNASIWVDIEGESWYNTGDMGRQDEQGYFWITGRKKELIIRGGHNIDPKSIEEPLLNHPLVALAAAVPRPDIRLGEVPIAYVQLKKDAVCDEAELLYYAQQHILEASAIPKQIRIIPAIPLTAVGKVYKPELLNRQIMEVYQELLSPIEGIHVKQITVIPDSVKGQLIQLYLHSSLEKNEIEKIVAAAVGQLRFSYQLILEEQ